MGERRRAAGVGGAVGREEEPCGEGERIRVGWLRGDVAWVDGLWLGGTQAKFVGGDGCSWYEVVVARWCIQHLCLIHHCRE